MKRMPRLRAALFTLLVVPAALADPVSVEIILFRQVAATQENLWPPAQPMPALANAQPLAEAASGVEPGFFTALPRSRLKLGGATSALQRAGTYEVLLHTAWRQPDAAGGPVYLTVPAVELDGLPALEASLGVTAAGKDLRLAGDVLVAVGSQRVHVRADQKFRKGELRYIDHALLGILVQVTPEVADGATLPDAAIAPAASNSVSVPGPPTRATPSSTAGPGPAD